MNKRLMEFLHELTEENERLESRCRVASDLKEMLMREISTQNKQIRELKAKVRRLKKGIPLCVNTKN